MSRYFSYFPKTLYSVGEDTNYDTATKITTRFAFEQSFKNNTSVFYEYDIQEGDTPEIIADKFYDNPERHWIVLLLNDIVDAQHDWPLDQRTLEKSINEKYISFANVSIGQTGTTWAKQNYHSYYQVITKTTTTKAKSVIKLSIDANTYANVTSSLETLTLGDGEVITIETTKERQSYYHYEVEQNEAKRKIKLLKPDFITAVENEFRTIIA